MSTGTLARDVIQTPTWPTRFFSKFSRFKPTLQQASVFEPVQRSVQVAVPCRSVRAVNVFEVLGYLKPEAFALALRLQVQHRVQESVF
jgi:hypothetical protein